MPDHHHEGISFRKLYLFAFITLNLVICVVLIFAMKMFFPCGFDNAFAPPAKCECKYKYMVDLTVKGDITPDIQANKEIEQQKMIAIFNQVDLVNGLTTLLYQANPDFYNNIEYELNYLKEQSLLNIKFISGRISYEEWDEDLRSLSETGMGKPFSGI